VLSCYKDLVGPQLNNTQQNINIFISKIVYFFIYIFVLIYLFVKIVNYHLILMYKLKLLCLVNNE